MLLKQKVSLTFQTDDKKFLNQLAYDKRHLEKLLHKLTEQKDTPTKFHGTIQKQVSQEESIELF